MTKASVAATDFRAALKAVAKVVERRSLIPILGTAKLGFKPNSLRITTTDADIWATSSCEAEVDPWSGGFDVCIRSKLLLQIAALATGRLTFEAMDDGHGGKLVNISGGGFDLTIRNLYPATDFPEPLQMPETAAFDLVASEAALWKWLKSVRFAVSTEETRYYLNGVHITKARDGGLRMEATNGHRLAQINPRGVQWDAPVASLILPRKTVDIILGALNPKGNRVVSLTPAEGRMRLQLENLDLVSKCIDGTYPDTSRVIPKPSDEVTASVSGSMLRLLPRIEGDYRAVAFDPVTQKMSVVDLSDGVTWTVPAEVKGNRPFGFNGSYLRDFLTIPGVDAYVIKGEATDGPFRIEVEDPDLTLVLMAMRV